jgi:hypothetical protein
MRLMVHCLLALVLFGAPAAAQDTRFAVAVKAGASAESSEDNLQGTSPALGITGSMLFGQGWRGEVEFWLPGYIDDARGDPKHRDVLVSFSAIKSFGAGTVRPFVAAGLSITRTQDWFSFCTANRMRGPDAPPEPVLVSCDDPDVISQRRERNDGTDGYLLAGGGVEWRLTRRIGFVADLRLSLAPVSVIVRPGVGVVVNF